MNIPNTSMTDKRVAWSMFMVAVSGHPLVNEPLQEGPARDTAAQLGLVDNDGALTDGGTRFAECFNTGKMSHSAAASEHAAELMVM